MYTLIRREGSMKNLKERKKAKRASQIKRIRKALKLSPTDIVLQKVLENYEEVQK